MITIILISIICTILGFFIFMGIIRGFDFDSDTFKEIYYNIVDLTYIEKIKLIFYVLVIFICWVMIVTVFIYG